MMEGEGRGERKADPIWSWVMRDNRAGSVGIL